MYLGCPDKLLYSSSVSMEQCADVFENQKAYLHGGLKTVQLFLGVYSKNVREIKVIRSSQDGFMKEKPCLTTTVAFYKAIKA